MPRILQTSGDTGEQVPLHRKFLGRVNKIFLLTVVVPTSAALLYFGLFASDVYVSEAQFIVRSPDKPATSGLGIILKSAGFSAAGDEASAARVFVQSRDALRTANRDHLVEAAYTRPSVSVFDRFNPLGLSGSFEDLYDYYRKRVDVAEDSTTLVNRLSVRAYTPEDAQKLNRRLLESAEALVNKLNERGRNDLVVSAEREAMAAQERARSASLALSAYRNSAQILDPEKQAQIQLSMISKLQEELIASRAQLLQLRTIAPDNPQIATLEQKIALLNRQIEAQTSSVAGGQASLANKAARYQRLALESQFAEKQLAASMASLEDARNEARRKQVYIERIAQPNLPDEALEPRRLRGILATLILGLVAWGIATMLIAGIREHQD